LSDLHEWYDLRVIEPILASLDEFQERDSGWALSRILNLIVNVNKFMPMHVGCTMQLPREIQLKKAVINVRSTDNACFAWSVVAALHPAESHVYRASSYPHYTTMLNIKDIEFPMALNQIKKFEHLHQRLYHCVLPIRVADKKMERHVNLLYLEGANDVGHFAWIKNICLHYFSSNEKLEAHTMDCEKISDCAIILPNDDDSKSLSFSNYNRKERVRFIVYADLACILGKADTD
ncbi:uncharacterized protein LOC143347526, partial [Colletes latitarsis]|uniref:uncharacterized protein LOC143347526 n=1 Tax=Colletes latitarsis TaxID=2605962 RepID=UPI004035A8D8